MINFASQTALSWYWLWHPLQGPGYQFWSGIGSDLSEITLLAIAYTMLRKHNCYEHRCWRIGTHRSQLDQHIRCRKHHGKHKDAVDYVDAKDGA